MAVMVEWLRRLISSTWDDADVGSNPYLVTFFEIWRPLAVAPPVAGLLCRGGRYDIILYMAQLNMVNGSIDVAHPGIQNFK